MQNDAFSTTTTKIKRLGSYLVEAGLIEQAHVDVALADQEATGMRFGDILVVRGWIKEQTIEYLIEKIVLPEREADDYINVGVKGSKTRASKPWN